MPSATSGKTSDRSSDPEVLPGKIVHLASIASTPFSVSYHSLKGTNILAITQSRTLSPSLRILSAFLKSSTIVHLQHHPSIQATVPFPQVQYLSIILRLATTSPPPFSTPAQSPFMVLNTYRNQDQPPHHSQGGLAKFKTCRFLQLYLLHFPATSQPKRSFRACFVGSLCSYLGSGFSLMKAIPTAPLLTLQCAIS